jgi:hypothetical protein
VPRLTLRPLVLALLLAACTRTDPPATTTSLPAAASSSPAAPLIASVVAPIAATPLPRVFSPPELDHAVHAELLPDGFCGIVRVDSSDASLAKPLTLVCHEGSRAVDRVELPFNQHQLLAANFPARRFLWLDGGARIWDRGRVSDAITGSFFEYGAAIGTTQALVLTGKPGKLPFIDRANGDKAARYRDGRWAFVALPKPAEKDWASCFWDAQVKPGSDDFVLLQICAAPRREFAYALFSLAAAADEATRIPFDNQVFDPVRASRGTFQVEEDGTIDLGSQSPGHSTLARYEPAQGAWRAIELRARTRLASSFTAHGPNVLWTSGWWGKDLQVSSDGGATFVEAEPVDGAPSHCNAFGCAFISMRDPARPSKVRFRRW